MWQLHSFCRVIVCVKAVNVKTFVIPINLSLNTASSQSRKN